MASNADMVDYLLPIETYYVLGGSRYEPYNTDCSGVVCAAFWHVFSLDPSELGTWTGGQWSSPATVEIWSGTSADLPWDSMQKGDIIFTSTESAGFDTVNGSHVGFYTGNPYSPFLSHFANGGPYVTAVNSVYGGRERYFGVKRYMPGAYESEDDDVSATDVWAYKTAYPNEMEIRTNNPDAYQMLYNASRQLTRTDTAGHDNPQGHDIFGRVQIIEKDVREMNAKLDKIIKKLG